MRSSESKEHEQVCAESARFEPQYRNRNRCMDTRTAGSEHWSGPRLGDETSEAALAAVIFGDRLLEHSAIEIGPVNGNEDELAIGRLPQEKVRQALLAAGADDEVGIGQIGCVETAGEQIG